MQLNTLNDLLEHELKDLYSAEKQILDALPKMARAASTPELRDAFDEHLGVTQNQFTRLQGVMSELGINPGSTKCEGMEGLITEGQEIIKNGGNAKVVDAALIGAAQRVEHYEIVGYGTARTIARELGHSNIAKALQTTLDEEAAADKKLTKLATGGFLSQGVNEAAPQQAIAASK